MIISHEYRFIFIKTRKTAGTSVEIALSEFCGPDDVITPISEEDEATRRSLGFPGPQNYHKGWGANGARDWARLALTGRRGKLFFNHQSAEQVRALVGRDVWDGYYTFTIERNPFDKFLSYYFWLNRDEAKHSSIDDAIAAGRAQLLSDQGGWGLYCDATGTRIAVDDVVRFEELAGAMTAVAERVGLPATPTLPRAKSGVTGPGRMDYRELLTDAQRAALEGAFAREIRHFGYKF